MTQFTTDPVVLIRSATFVQHIVDVVSENCARVGSRKSRCMLVPLARVTLSPRKQALKADLHHSICQGTDLALEGVNTGTAYQEKSTVARWLHR